MGRQGILQSMVLYDINREEAMEIARKNLLEYRSDEPPVVLGKRSALATTADEVTSSESPVKDKKKVYRGDKILEVNKVSDLETV